MARRGIHQFVAGFTDNDAISNQARIIRRLLEGAGFSSNVYCEEMRISPDHKDEATDVVKAADDLDESDVAILHMSTGSVVNDAFADLKCRKAIIYHNITPPHYFAAIRSDVAETLARGREQLKMLAGVADINLAVSRYNASELEELHYKNVQVLPLLLELDVVNTRSPRDELIGGSSMTTVIFVGRCAPNKMIEDLVEAFDHYQKNVNPDSCFVHVGSYNGMERYYYGLVSLIREAGIQNFHFAGSVPQERLNALYRDADLFLCMSEHEGFCIPLLESMASDTPVLAYSAAAVPETLDGAGVMFKEKLMGEVSEMMGEMTSDDSLRSSVIDGQRKRIERYRQRNMEQELRDSLLPVIEL